VDWAQIVRKFAYMGRAAILTRLVLVRNRQGAAPYDAIELVGRLE
jgi:hypothetical protein